MRLVTLQASNRLGESIRVKNTSLILGKRGTPFNVHESEDMRYFKLESSEQPGCFVTVSNTSTGIYGVSLGDALGVSGSPARFRRVVLASGVQLELVDSPGYMLRHTSSQIEAGMQSSRPLSDFIGDSSFRWFENGQQINFGEEDTSFEKKKFPGRPRREQVPVIEKHPLKRGRVTKALPPPPQAAEPPLSVSPPAKIRRSKKVMDNPVESEEGPSPISNQPPPASGRGSLEAFAGNLNLSFGSDDVAKPPLPRRTVLSTSALIRSSLSPAPIRKGPADSPPLYQRFSGPADCPPSRPSSRLSAERFSTSIAPSPLAGPADSPPAAVSAKFTISPSPSVCLAPQPEQLRRRESQANQQERERQLSAQLAEKNSEMMEISSELDRLQTDLADLPGLRDRLAQLSGEHERNFRLESEVTGLTLRLREWEGRAKDAEERVGTMEGVVVGLRSEIGKIENDSSDLRNRLNIEIAKNSEIETKFSQKCQALDSALMELMDKEVELIDFANSLEVLKKEKKTLESEKLKDSSDLAILSENLEILNCKISEIEIKNQLLETERVRSGEEISRLSASLANNKDRLSRESCEREKQVTDLMVKIHTLAGRNAVWEKEEIELRESAKRLCEANRELERIRSELSSFTEENSENIRKLQNIQNELKDEREKNEKNEIEILKLRTSVKKFDAVRRGRDQARASIGGVEISDSALTSARPIEQPIEQAIEPSMTPLENRIFPALKKITASPKKIHTARPDWRTESKAGSVLARLRARKSGANRGSLAGLGQKPHGEENKVEANKEETETSLATKTILPTALVTPSTQSVVPISFSLRALAGKSAAVVEPPMSPETPFEPSMTPAVHHARLDEDVTPVKATRRTADVLAELTNNLPEQTGLTGLGVDGLAAAWRMALCNKPDDWRQGVSRIDEHEFRFGSLSIRCKLIGLNVTVWVHGENFLLDKFIDKFGPSQFPKKRVSITPQPVKTSSSIKFRLNRAVTNPHNKEN